MIRKHLFPMFNAWFVIIFQPPPPACCFVASRKWAYMIYMLSYLSRTLRKIIWRETLEVLPGLLTNATEIAESNWVIGICVAVDFVIHFRIWRSRYVVKFRTIILKSKYKYVKHKYDLWLQPDPTVLNNIGPLKTNSLKHKTFLWFYLHGT